MKSKLQNILVLFLLVGATTSLLCQQPVAASPAPDQGQASQKADDFMQRQNGDVNAGDYQEPFNHNHSSTSQPQDRARVSVGFSITVIVVIAIIFAVGLFLSFQESANRRKKRMAASIKTAYSLQNEYIRTKAEQKLVQYDPAFNKEVLKERIWQAFRKFQIAWANQDMKPVRHFVSDGIYERFSLQLAILKASGISSQMKNIEIRNVRLALVEADETFDRIHFLITAQAVSNFVETETQKVVYGNDYREIFTEYWSFLRRRNTKSLEKPGLFEDHCPNCGTRFTETNIVSCPQCQSNVNSGDYDWVLADITNASEWDKKPKRTIPGLKAIKETDHNFTLEHIEDRVMAMFYRHQAACFFADKSYVASLATEAFLQSHDDEYQALDNGCHRFFADAIVCAIEVVEIKPAENKESNSQIRVKVKWMGHRQEKQVPSLIVPDPASSELFIHEFIIVRAANAESSHKNILTSTHCPGCGAQQAERDAQKCDQCGSVLNDTSHQWLLSHIRPFSGYPRTANRYEALEYKSRGITDDDTSMSVFDNESLIACAAAAMMIDGVIDEKEQELLSYFARLRRIPNTRLNAIVNSVKNGNYQIPKPEDIIDAREFMRCLVQMCLVDGKVTEQELEFLQSLVNRMGYTTWDIEMIINQERTQMFKFSQKIIKSLQNPG